MKEEEKNWVNVEVNEWNTSTMDFMWLVKEIHAKFTATEQE